MAASLRRALVVAFAVACVLSALLGACTTTYTPTPDLPRDRVVEPLLGPAPPGAFTRMVLSVPNLVPPGPTPGAWTPSTLVQVSSIQLSVAATSADRVSLVGSNDPSASVTTAYALASVSGPSGNVPVAVGAWAYLAVVRTAGTTTGLSLALGGDDGTSSSVDGGATLANQGAPNAGGALAWPVTDAVAEGLLGTIKGDTDVLITAVVGVGFAIPSGVSMAGAETLGGSAAPLRVGATPGVSSLSVVAASDGFHTIVDSGTITCSGTVTATQGTSPWLVSQSGSPWGVSGTVTANIGTTNGLALDATLTGGTQIANRSSITPVINTSLVASLAVKASSGKHVSTLVQVDATAPSATYYVQMLQGSATCPVDGAITFLHAPITVVHTSGTPNTVVLDDGSAPATFTTGLCVALSSTQFTKTAAGSYLIVDSSVL